MKNFIILTMLALAMSFVSCNSDDTLASSNPIGKEVVVESDSLASLQARISALNEKKHANCPNTRSWFTRFCRRVLADAVGALFGNLYGGPAGAVVGAASFSAGAVAIESSCTENSKKDETMKMNEARCSLKDVVPPTKGTKVAELDSLGYYHNAILLKTNIDYQAISELPEVLMNEVQNSFPNLGTVSISDSLKVIKAYNEFYKVETKYNGGDNFDEYAAHLVTYYPRHKGEIGVVVEFLKGLNEARLTSESNKYVGEVLNLVENTSLPADTKQDLRNAIIVGNASNRLWNAKSEYKEININEQHSLLEEK